MSYKTAVMRFVRMAIVVGVVGVGLSAARAEPAGRPAVPMLPQGRPLLPPVLRAQLQEATARGLAEELAIVPPTDVRLRLYAAPDLLECDGGPCAARVATVLRAGLVVTTTVDRLGKSYTIRLHAFGADGRELGPPIEERCEICTLREAEIATERAAARVAPLVRRVKLATRR